MKMRIHGTMTVLAVAATLLLAAHEAGAGARRSRPLKTGQTTCWTIQGLETDCAGTGQDGDLQRGEPPSRVDQGDGTIRDRRTALTWEKLSDDGSIHDKDDTYDWSEDGAFAKIAELNTVPCFAGFCDWRLPNRFELQTLVDVEQRNPAIPAVFNTDCGANSGGNPGCTVTTCSCTTPSPYWSSSTVEISPGFAWIVEFFDGTVGGFNKSFPKSVRAVRGGAQ